MSLWSSADDEILINFVKTHEEFYNTKCKNYRNTQFKHKLWSEIAEVLNKTDTDCCKRWCYVRDYYIRRKGKPGTGASGEAAKKRAYLLSFLDHFASSHRNSTTHFVEHENQGDGSENIEDTPDNYSEGTQSLTHEMQETTYDNYENDNEQEGMSDEDISKDIAIDSNGDIRIQNSKKRKNYIHGQERLTLHKHAAHVKASTCDELDENDHFFRSMAKIVKRLPKYDQAHLRMQIGSLVGNAELRHISNDSAQISEFSPIPTKWET